MWCSCRLKGRFVAFIDFSWRQEVRGLWGKDNPEISVEKSHVADLLVQDISSTPCFVCWVLMPQMSTSPSLASYMLQMWRSVASVMSCSCVWSDVYCLIISSTTFVCVHMSVCLHMCVCVHIYIFVCVSLYLCRWCVEVCGCRRQTPWFGWMLAANSLI